MPLNTTVPTSITPQLLQLCGGIASGVPVWVQVVPSPSAEPRECFPSVREMVERQGGRIVYGWALWECRPIFVEAEHHAVYEQSTGSPWIDVTPHVPPIRRILFLSDDNATYDFGTTDVRDNFKMSTVDNPMVSHLLALFSKRIEILNRVPAVGGAVT